MSKGLKIGLLVSGLAIVGLAAFIVMKLMPSTDHLKLIPKDAGFVFTADLKGLAAKADPEKIKNLKFMKRVSEQLERGGERTKVFKRLQDDPTSAGIDVLQDAYAFGQGDLQGDGVFGVVFKVSSASNLEEFLKGVDKGFTVEKGNGYQFVKIDRHAYLAWNSSAGMLLGSNRGDVSKKADEFFAQKEDASILANKSFKEFRKKKYDLAIFVNYEGLSALVPRKRGMDDSETPAPPVDFAMLKGLYVGMTLSFDNDDITINSQYYSEDNSKLDAYNVFKEKGLSPEALQMITNKTVMAIAAANIDFKKWYNVVANMEPVKPKMDELRANLGMSDAELQDLLGGEISFAVVDYKEMPKPKAQLELEQHLRDMEESFSKQYGGPNGEGYTSSEIEMNRFTPVFTLNIGVNNKGALEKLLQKTGLPQQDKMYVSSSMVGDFYFVETTQGISITNDKDIATALAQGGKLNAVPQEPVKSLVSENPISFYFDLTPSHYSDATHDYLKKSMGDYSYGRMIAFMKPFKDVTAKGKDMNFTFMLDMEKGDGSNSLYRIISDIDETFVQ
ncbi:MAG TPA: DUF4836 family protein [Bacteroidia bacterium]|jgi:hypothetical protein